MSNMDWLSLLGAATGIAGAVMGFISLRRTDQYKALDLRLELKRAQSSLLADAQELDPLLNLAKRSHTRMAAATGMYGSGGTKAWLADWEQDLNNTRLLLSDVTAFQTDCSSLPYPALENRLVDAHLLQRRVNQMREKYQASLSRDEKRGDNLRADQRLMTQARLQDKGDGKP